MELSYFVRKSPEEVFAYLSDAQKFVTVHPVISKIDVGEGGYTMHETLKFAGLLFSFHYPATIQSDSALNQVVMKATVRKVVHISICFNLTSENGGTRVSEIVNFRSVLPVHPVMRYIFKKQHRLLFNNLEAAA